MNIRLVNNDSKGAAMLKKESKRLAEMTYSIASERLIIIDHTEVDSSLKGQGIGKKLLLKIVEMARQDRIKILPLCPFAKAMFEKDPSMRDVLKT